MARNRVSAGSSASAQGSLVLPSALLERLADGRDHSRTRLRELLALGAGEIEDQLHQLEATGLEIVTNADNSLRLAEPIDWIELAAIKSALCGPYLVRIDSIERCLEVASTNRHLLGGRPPETGKIRIAIAEYQTAGRGRRGRDWAMPPGAGIALSVSWYFGQEPAGLSALSLAVGAAARRAIRDVTDLDIDLKWPNDLIVDDGKLGGILVELSQMPDGGCHVVAGIGINVKVPDAYLASVSNFPQGARDLSSFAPEWSIDRAALAVALIERLIELFGNFADTGFTPYRQEWLEAHILNGKAIELHTGSGRAYGVVHGIGLDGALVIANDSGERRSIISGDVTIRADHDVRD